MWLRVVVSTCALACAAASASAALPTWATSAALSATHATRHARGARGARGARRARGARGAAPRARNCEADCHGRGVCNRLTGVCACRVGFNGSSCATRNPRPCNGPKDGLWIASHCAGECDEERGWCWCPGKVHQRPMGEHCQPSHMPLSAFAALGLPPHLDQGLLLAGSAPSLPLPQWSDRSAADRELARRKSDFESARRRMYRDPEEARRTRERFWHGVDGTATELSAEPLFTKASARGTHPPWELLPNASAAARAKRGSSGGSASPAWCEARRGEKPLHSCGCSFPGLHGALCESRHEVFCLNQCAGHGRCDSFGGHCHCDRGYFGVDCSMTTEEVALSDGRVKKVVRLHEAHAARRTRAPATPRIYVYELPEHTTHILQYAAAQQLCAPRHFDSANRTVWNNGYAYTVDVALHEWLLRSAHRTVNAKEADFFFVPVYLSCLILPVFDYVGPASYMSGFPMRPVTAMRAAKDALEQVKALPYWARSGGRDHLFLFSHDEGGCWAPAEIARDAVLLTHWGRTDAHPDSSSRYMADNWRVDWRTDIRAPSGKRWSFPGGSLAMIGDHPCFDPRKDLVIPVFRPPSHYADSPWLRSAGTPTVERSTLAYFSGNLAEREPLKYARGIRHRLRESFSRRPGWVLVRDRGHRYSNDLASAEFCIVPPGGDGWSSRVDDAVRHGCIPVIIMDGVQMPFEGQIDYDAFALRVAERDVERLDHILRAVPKRRRKKMREAMSRHWLRFTYARAILDDLSDESGTVAPASAEPGKTLAHNVRSGYLPRAELPRASVGSSALHALRLSLTGCVDCSSSPIVGEMKLHDATDTIMNALAKRLPHPWQKSTNETQIEIQSRESVGSRNRHMLFQ